jgi:hypothetical protein
MKQRGLMKGIKNEKEGKMTDSEVKGANFIRHHQIEKAFEEWNQSFFNTEEPPPTVEKEEDDPIAFQNFQKEVISPNTKTDGDKLFLMTLTTQIKILFKQQLDTVYRLIVQLSKSTFESFDEKQLENEMNEINKKGSWWQSAKSFFKKLWDLFNSRPVQLIFWIMKTIVSKFMSLSKFVFSNPKTTRILAILAIRYKDALCQELSIWLNFYKVKNNNSLDFSNVGQMKDIFFANLFERIQVFTESDQFDSVWNSTAVIVSSASLYLLPGIGLGVLTSVLQQPILRQFLVTFNESLKISVRTAIQMTSYLSEVKESWKLLFDAINFQECIHPVILTPDELQSRPWAGALKGLSKSLFSKEFLESQGFKPDVSEEIDKLLFSGELFVKNDPEICQASIDNGLATEEIGWMDYLAGLNFFGKESTPSSCRFVDIFSEDFNKNFDLSFDQNAIIIGATKK